jgi:DNA helicase-2/ATP-dependent DNA helicase PcrA
VPRAAAGARRERRRGPLRAAPDVDAEARWVADEVVAGLSALPAATDGAHWSRAAVLCRKRSMFPRLRAAFDALDVPVEVVGLGGLLAVPEVADLRATLQVLDDPTADAALLRLLTGARWRIGPRDLAALGRRARSSCAAAPRRPTTRWRRSSSASTSRRSARSSTRSTTCLPRVSATRCRPRAPAARGAARRAAGAAPPRRPAPARPGGRRRATLGLDVEVSARPGTTDPAAARADLDAFADAARSSPVTSPRTARARPCLSAFLAHLSAAEDEEHGLDTGAVSGADTVKLMTVHAPRASSGRWSRSPAWPAAPAGERRLPGPALGEHLVDGQLPPAAVPPAR